MGIVVKSDREIATMRQAGKIVAMVLEVLAGHVKAGMKTAELDEVANRELSRHGARPSFKGYRGYPSSLCVSVNDEIVHGIPGARVLKEGDIVSIDFGVIYKGFQGDSAVTVGIGKVDPEAQGLIEATRGALEAGIAAVHNGGRLGDISAAIQGYAESMGYAVVREYGGHGIGREMHEEPLIHNFGRAGTGPLLRKGMTVALEPMLTNGDWRTRLAGDGWTVLTTDGSLAAHFEHTVAVTENGAEILTRC